MPLHDWSALSGWEGVHHLWISELLYALKPLLPPAYRAYIGTTPTFAVGPAEDGRPDVSVRDWPTDLPTATGIDDAGPEPDEEFIAVAALTLDPVLLIGRAGRLVAAVELISPGNKDRDSFRSAYSAAYAGYLRMGVHLLLVDVHRRPAGFSFADAVARELGMPQPPTPTPHVVGYRVGGPSPGGGRFLAVWRRPLAVGEPLPTTRLALSVDESVAVDLEATYRRAAEAAYLT